MFFPDEPWSFLFLSICVFAAPIGAFISLVWSFRLTEQKRERLLISSTLFLGVIAASLAAMGDFWNWNDEMTFKASIIIALSGLFLLLLWLTQYPKPKQRIILPLIFGFGTSFAATILLVIFE